MKKSLASIFIFLLSCVTLLSAGPVENLYTLVVPQGYGLLLIEGGLGSAPLSSQTEDLIQINMGFDPFDLSIDSGVLGIYWYGKQTLENSTDLHTQATVVLTDTYSTFNFEGTGTYKSYTLDFQGIPGFYAFGLHTQIDTTLFSGNFTTLTDLDPSGAIGIGRIYTITALKQIELMFKYLAIPLTEENVRTAAEFIYTRDSRLLRYSDDNRLNYTNYYQDLAQALKVPDKVLNLIFIDYSQEYAFEKARFDNLLYGWEAQLAVMPKFHIQTSNNYSETDLILSGDYATFLMENRLHFQANGSMGVTYASEDTEKYSFTINLGGRARYLPENYHWWFDSGVQVFFDTKESPMFEMQLNGELNYLLTPNFVTYAGIAIQNNFQEYTLYAGGRYRIW
jgi:hypothetical protein